jgi:hypothetical protein
MTMKTLLVGAALSVSVLASAQNQSWTATDINGNEVSIQALLDEGKTVLVDISAYWCGPCWAWHTSRIMDKLYHEFGPDGTNDLAIIWVDGDAATTLALLNGGSGSQGDWVTGTTADIEAGYRFLTVLQKFDLFGTFRYRPVEALVQEDMREYRAIVESYLFGAKGRMALNSKLVVNASAELGMSQTHLNPNDSLPSVDQSLEKSGVDLNLGGGVSYLVLEKFAVGGKLTLGTGAFKSVQLGVDLRFML